MQNLKYLHNFMKVQDIWREERTRESQVRNNEYIQITQRKEKFINLKFSNMNAFNTKRNIIGDIKSRCLP